MNYKISKSAPDGRTATERFNLIDGTYVVCEYTPDTKDRVERIKAFGYLVEETDMEPGTYREADDQPVGEKVAKSDAELDELKAALDEKGIKYHHKAGVKKLKELLDGAD